MTEVAFHFGAPDKIAYACRLLRKAVNTGATIQVVCGPSCQEQLDALLWSVSPTDFVTHCDRSASDLQRELSAVLLSGSPETDQVNRQVLVNLGSAVPIGYDRYQRLIEVVGTDDSDRVLARERWKHYTMAGYTIVRHDLAQSGASS